VSGFFYQSTFCDLILNNCTPILQLAVAAFFQSIDLNSGAAFYSGDNLAWGRRNLNIAEEEKVFSKTHPSVNSGRSIKFLCPINRCHDTERRNSIMYIKRSFAAREQEITEI
jgi:hypothetical protein